MKNFTLENMKYNYFVGDFEPTAYHNKNVEICLKKLCAGTLDARYYRKTSDEIMLIVDGIIDVNGILFSKGSVLVWEKEEIINLFALEDVELLVIKVPGGQDDFFDDVHFESYEEAEAFYQYYFNKILQMNNNQCVVGERIADEDISVVVQGYVDYYTEYTIKSIRQYMPGATIVLSTWKECNVNGLDYDKLITSDDPGAVDCSRWSERIILNNGNRQIVSTQRGLEAVKTKYTLKLRSDLMLLGSDITRYINLMDKIRDDKYALFEKRIIIGELFTREDFSYHHIDKRYSVPQPFHPSDWFAFGLTKDIWTLYGNVSLISEPEMANYQCKHMNYVEENDYKYSWRYTTEQHIFLENVRRRFPDLQFDDWTDWNADAICLSGKLMLNNFIVLNFLHHQILNLKYTTTTFANSGLRHSEMGLYTHDLWMKGLKREEYGDR